MFVVRRNATHDIFIPSVEAPRFQAESAALHATKCSEAAGARHGRNVQTQKKKIFF
jgi:hypothetical protein